MTDDNPILQCEDCGRFMQWVLIGQEDPILAVKHMGDEYGFRCFFHRIQMSRKQTQDDLLAGFIPEHTGARDWRYA